MHTIGYPANFEVRLQTSSVLSTEKPIRCTSPILHPNWQFEVLQIDPDVHCGLTLSLSCFRSYTNGCNEMELGTDIAYLRSRSCLDPDFCLVGTHLLAGL